MFIFIVTDKYPTKIGLVRKAEPRQHNPSELTLNQIRQFYASVPAQNFAWKLHTNTVQGQYDGSIQNKIKYSELFWFEMFQLNQT